MAKKRRTRKKPGRKKASRRGRPRGGSRLAGASTDDLRRELERRESKLDDLMAQREALEAELAELDAELRELGESAGPANGRRKRKVTRKKRGPGRPRKKRTTRATGRRKKKTTRKKRGRRKTTARKKTSRRGGGRGRRRSGHSLPDVLERVLKRRTLSVSEAADAAKKAGYKTKSNNFRTIVNQALISNSDRFKKVARGQYTAK